MNTKDRINTHQKNISGHSTIKLLKIRDKEQKLNKTEKEFWLQYGGINPNTAYLTHCLN